MTKKLLPLFAVVPVFSLVLVARAQTAKPIPIPLKPDPPLTIDGDLGDWNAVPDAIEINTKEHATYGGANWKSAQDLSATVHLAWRQETLYVAAEVTDNVLRQTERGSNLWKGDHVELYLDTAPDTDPDKNIFGPRQFQIGLSPGNFSQTGDALADITPEAYAFLPAGATAKGTQVGATRTANGYIIEAAIPWTIFNFKPQVGLPLGVEVAVSDTDGIEASQGKLLTIGTAEWNRSRNNLQRAVLANADGSAPASVTSTPVFETNSLKEGESKTVTFDAPTIPDGYEAVLSLQARLDTPKAAGYTQALQVTLNGKTFDIKRIANKKSSETMPSGKTLNTAAGENFTVPYAPDFDATDKSTSYALQDAKAALFEFRVTDLLKSTGNVLTIKNTERAGIEKTLVVGNAKLLYRIPPIEKVLLGPPSGALPQIAPQNVQPVSYKISDDNNGTSLEFNGNTYKVASQYSTPDGKWVTDSNKYFSVKRQLEKKGEWIVVHDTFTNLTSENLPLMHRDEVKMNPEKVWLGGLSPSNVNGTSSNPHNPTVFGIQGKSGIGLLPLDDVFQVHITNYSTADSIGLMDNNLVLKPKSTYTADWAIVPVASADNFDFINATRRLLDVNYQFDGSFAFMRAHPKFEGSWSDQKIIDFAKFKDAKYLCINIGYPYYKGRTPQGTALQQIDHTAWVDAIARRRKLIPDAKQLAYFHCFIDVADEAPEKYKDSQLIMPDGTQGDYGQSIYKLFVPTLTDSYGPAIAKNIDLILDDMKLDGVYWDEMDRSRYFYTYNPDQWDGISADIDPKTMQITRLKSSVTLLSQPWRLQQAQRIMKQGVLIANGGTPATRTMRNLHYVGFNETGSISNCVNSQLFTPIALGDHLTERSEEDAYHTMLNALNYGCVYYWYNDVTVIPTYHTLTEYMFPFTPVELHEGYVIGKERIITNRSGVFGWGDNAKHEVHVFDNTGREVDLKNIKAPTVIKTFEKDGKTWTEIRIGEGWSAAILRK
jgi:hypothetical protein